MVILYCPQAEGRVTQSNQVASYIFLHLPDSFILLQIDIICFCVGIEPKTLALQGLCLRNTFTLLQTYFLHYTDLTYVIPITFFSICWSHSSCRVLLFFINFKSRKKTYANEVCDSSGLASQK